MSPLADRGSLRVVLRTLPWVLAFAGIGLSVWAMRDRSSTSEALTSVMASNDSLRLQLRELALARDVAERLREKAEGLFNNMEISRDEAAHRYAAEKAAAQEALAQSIRAIKEKDAKEIALVGEQEARALADARADSVEKEKQRVDLAQRRAKAGTLAQNSMAIKGDGPLRGLMAVQAFHTMTAAGGDPNKIEVARALYGALDELERGHAPGISKLGAGPRTMVQQGEEVLALGNDGVLIAINGRQWTKRVVRDLSGNMRPGGRAFLSDNGRWVMLTSATGGIDVIAVSDGSTRARQEQTPHTEGITVMAVFNDGDVLVSGDRNGKLIVWSFANGGLQMIKQHAAGGQFRAMVHERSTDKVAAINGTGSVFILSRDGALGSAALPDAERAHALASGTSGNQEVLLGTHSGSVYAMALPGPGFRIVHPGNGQRVESLAAAADGRVATVDAVRTFSVFEAKNSPFSVPLTGIPNVMLFDPSGEQVLLASDDRTIRRVLTRPQHLADQLCALITRTWTAEEWEHHVGEGALQDPCAGK